MADEQPTDQPPYEQPQPASVREYARRWREARRKRWEAEHPQEVAQKALQKEAIRLRKEALERQRQRRAEERQARASPWGAWTGRQLHRLHEMVRQSGRTAWGKRVENWVTSLYRRLRIHQRPRLRETCPAATWEEAASRMWHQAHSAYRRHKRTPWERWAFVVSKCFYTREGVGYGRVQESAGHQGERPVDDAGGTEVQLCFDWPDADPGVGRGGSPDTHEPGRVA